MAALSDDVYLAAGLEQTRPAQEYNLLERLRARDLPVPEPIAARVAWLGGGRYRGDLITAAIPDAASMARRLYTDAAAALPWAAIGARIARFHAAGARHADLNARNILLDAADRVWLIDWERGRQGRRAVGGRPNLRRLRRSLAREPELETAARTHWQQLVAGYRRVPG